MIGMLRWINGDVPDACASAVVARFLASAPDLVGLAGGRAITLRQFAQLRQALISVLDRGAEPQPVRGAPVLAAVLAQMRGGRPSRVPVRGPRHRPYPVPLSLRYELVASRPPRPVTRNSRTGQPRRQPHDLGVPRLRVSGTFRDVVVYTWLRVVTAEDAPALRRCVAPAPRSSEPCGRWFIAQGGRRGAPRTYCSDACRQRAHQHGPSRALAVC